jgi:hypothetical protein
MNHGKTHVQNTPIDSIPALTKVWLECEREKIARPQTFFNRRRFYFDLLGNC